MVIIVHNMEEQPLTPAANGSTPITPSPNGPAPNESLTPFCVTLSVLTEVLSNEKVLQQVCSFPELTNALNANLHLAKTVTQESTIPPLLGTELWKNFMTLVYTDSEDLQSQLSILKVLKLALDVPGVFDLIVGSPEKEGAHTANTILASTIVFNGSTACCMDNRLWRNLVKITQSTDLKGSAASPVCALKVLNESMDVPGVSEILLSCPEWKEALSSLKKLALVLVNDGTSTSQMDKQLWTQLVEILPQQDIQIHSTPETPDSSVVSVQCEQSATESVDLTPLEEGISSLNAEVAMIRTDMNKELSTISHLPTLVMQLEAAIKELNDTDKSTFTQTEKWFGDIRNEIAVLKQRGYYH